MTKKIDNFFVCNFNLMSMLKGEYSVEDKLVKFEH